MNRSIIVLVSFLFYLSQLTAQYVSLTPASANPEEGMVTLTFDASQGGGELVGTDKVYLHHGVVIEGPEGFTWEYVIGNWGEDDGVGEMTKVDGQDDQWQYTFSPNIRSHFGVPDEENLYRISCVFRNADGSIKGTITPGEYGWGSVTANFDVYIDLNSGNFLDITSPIENQGFHQPGEEIFFSVNASAEVSEMTMSINESQVARVEAGRSITYNYPVTESEEILISAKATIDGEELEISKSYNIIVRSEPVVAPVPEGMELGVNYHEGDTSATLVLEAPGKEFAYVVGDFTDWKVLPAFLMHKTPDGELHWLHINNLEPGQSYVYQYWIEEDVKVGDPYGRLVVDPWNDEFISEDVFPDIPPYDKTEYGPATVLQTGQSPYQWSANEAIYERPDINHLMVYEMHMRDFLASSSYKDLLDTLDYIADLGINAIELMPINEFEGNDSWGYNPSYFFALDKYYGTANDLKRFIDACHQRGIAVIQDIVYNHAYGQCPLGRMYLDDTGQPSAENPWFNQEVIGPFDFGGYDFNHESPYTQAFVDRSNKYWLEEFHIDGFRFDFTKGLTNNAPNNSLDAYDADRIAICQRMADKVWEVDPEAYVILEHFGGSTEEKELSDYGCKLWANRSYDYVPPANGNPGTGSFAGMDRQTHISYFNSHDERRLIEHVITEGRRSGSYNTRDTLVALERAKLAAAFTYLIPGPKMMWQFDELGYDVYINFNGRVGRKPLPWGEGSLGYYDDPLRQNVYQTIKGLLTLRNTFTPQALAVATTNHQMTGAVRRLSYDMESADLIVVGNFGVNTEEGQPMFTQEGIWYDYFFGDSLQISSTDTAFTLQPGEWHVYTTSRMPSAPDDAVAIWSNPVTIAPNPFSLDQEITITFDATKAHPDGSAGLVGSESVIMYAGLVVDNPNGEQLSYITGDVSQGGMGIMSKVEGETDLWEITLVPRDYFGIPEGEKAYRIGMYFRDEANENFGKGFQGTTIFFDIDDSVPFVSIDPLPFTADEEITIRFNAAKGNRELVGAEKVYMHSSVNITETDNPAPTSWNFTVGNWGNDDGIGEMTKVEGEDNIWEIKLTPAEYYGLADDDQPTWLAAVFRNADGSIKGTGSPGELPNGFIAENLDFFIKNETVVSTTEHNVLPYELYPNPTSGVINLHDFPGKLDFQLFELSGKLLANYKMYESKIVDLSSMPKGMYLYRIITKEGQKSGKIIVM